MKIQRSAIWVIGIGTILLVLALWFSKKASHTAVPEHPEANSEQSPIERGSTANQQAGLASRTNSLNGQVFASGNASNIHQQTKTAQMREGLAQLNDDDVVLYGRLVDQFDAPVAEAEVAGTIQVNNGLRVGTDRLVVKTDTNGVFMISVYKGKNLGVFPTKPGYVLASLNTTFTFSHLWPESERHNPDPNNPVVIKMWKLQEKEPLLNINGSYKLKFTAAAINFDLVASKVVPAGGDLKITINRPQGAISQQHPQNWSITVEVANGGFITTSVAESRIAFSAPESGYRTSGTFENNNGPGLVDQMLFIRSRGEQVYSKVRLLFGINAEPEGFMNISIKGVANTNGSRNWEATAPE